MFNKAPTKQEETTPPPQEELTPPKQEELTKSPSPPVLPTQQKVQIVKSADGRMEVRGLRLCQQLLLRPDGKLFIITMQDQQVLKFMSAQQKLPKSQQLRLVPKFSSSPLLQLPKPMSEVQPQCSLSCLPDPALEKVMSYLPYDTIAELRRVNKRFDAICKSLLNKGFRIAQRNVSSSHQEAMSKLPRRLSQRHSHPMYNDYAILRGTDLQISMLKLVFEKFIKDQLCCFIPGKILDEIFIILSTLREQEDAPYSILNELRDLCSMAIEYFEEKIAPSFKKEQAPFHSPLNNQSVDLTVKFQTEEGDDSDRCGDQDEGGEAGSDEGEDADEHGDGDDCEGEHVADILKNKEAIRACNRRVLKLTKQKKLMKMQLKNMAMQMKQQNKHFNATLKYQKANFKVTMKQQRENFEATVKQQKENFEVTMKEMKLKIGQLDKKVKNQEFAEPDISKGTEGISAHSIAKKIVKVKDEIASEIIDGIVTEVSQKEETRSSKRKREDF